MRYVVLDTETTGLEVRQGHRIIEIGCIEVNGRQVTDKHFHEYVNPEREVDEGAFQVHGISDEMLADKPKFKQIAKDFLDFIQGSTLIIHNASFDIGFLDGELERLGLGKTADYVEGVIDSLGMAREMFPGKRNNLDALCDRLGVNAAALRQLGHFWPMFVGGETPKIFESKSRPLAEVASQLGLKLDTATLRDLASEVEWRKTSNLSLSSYEKRAYARAMPGNLAVADVLAVMNGYEDLKDARGQIDMEDVLLLTAGLLESEAAAAMEVRERYRFFVVDEYQDVSPLQHHLLDLWLGDHRDLCVVGDASQTIYSFTGATSAINAADSCAGLSTRNERFGSSASAFQRWMRS